MTANRNLTIQGIHVQTLYSEYRSHRYLINRKYQRKLAWTIEEKRNFIDTLEKGLPIPLFLFAEVQKDETTVLEVIDGMQRLDAIFSFIEQRFKLMNGFFDLSTTADTLALKKERVLQQRTPVLDAKICKQIANYLLPISKTSFYNNIEIEDTFRRINSNGRHLSPQELRQAGAIGKFPNLVRIISSQIRGDYSNDSLFLNEMAKISLSNRRLEYYGLNLFDVFWIKHKILSHQSLRSSRDEEIVAHLLANIILENGANYTAFNLDSYYGFSSNPLASIPKEKSMIESAVDRVSPERIIKQFNHVHNTIEELLEKKHQVFTNLIYRNARTEENYRAYHAIFMSFYELIIKQNKLITDEDGLINSINLIGEDLLRFDSIGDLFNHRRMANAVNSIVGRIQHNFALNEQEDPALQDWTKEFSNILMQSNTEQDLFEFKIGLYDLKKKKLNKDLINKITKTLSAIVNKGPNKVGYVIIGIANSKEHAEKHKEEYGIQPIQKNNFYITGIEDEATYCCRSVDNYLHQFKEALKQAPIEPKEFLNEILSNFKSRLYFGKEVIVIKTNFSKPVWYDGELYQRLGSHNEIVPKELHSKVYERFFK